MVAVKDKKEFLSWLVNQQAFSRREIIWILNYLTNHEAILMNVRIVEKADKTTRGLMIQSGDNHRPMILSLEGKEFHDPDQIFHEIRMNWKKDLFLECRFPEAWQEPLYLKVLEDNPFASWNEVDEEIDQEITAFLEQEAQAHEKADLLREIDEALESGDQETFIRLSEQLKQHS